ITVDLSKNQTAEQRAQEKEKVVEAAEDMVVDARQQIENKKFDEARDEIRATIKEKGLSDKVQVTEEKDYLLVTLESEVFFDSGSADIRPDSMKLLSSLAEILKSIDKEILISGHTDNVPINSTEFKSNWELSTARATNVVGYFIETAKMDPTTFTATGNGEYRPIADNATAEGRQKNRRIEIKILK
ncbi:MAG: OmpA family protein, partial [Clostridia bacterium]|nr:OmpA family protein [Clostridia bacterium]